MPFYKETPEIKLAPQAREEHRSHHLSPRKGPQAGPGHASTLVTVGSQHEPSCELHGGWFTLPCTCTHSHSYSHTRGRHTHTHTRKGTGQWARASASQDHESDQLSRTHWPVGHSRSPSRRSQNAQKGPPAHLPSGVLLVNKVDQLIGQRREIQAAPGTGQHQQAAEGGQEPPHFGNWIGDSPGEERTRDISTFLPSAQVLDTHKASPQDAPFWGPRPILSPPSAPSCSLVSPSGNRGSAECLQGPWHLWALMPCLRVPARAHSTQDCTMD